MRSRAAGAVLKDVRTLLDIGTSTGLSDSQLLERYLLRRDDSAEAAFTALVERHGPMVLRACRGVLHDTHAAEDAFQATFLILARKAGAIRKRDSVASWLFGVARRVAHRAKARRQRTAARETQGIAMLEAKATSSDHGPGSLPEIHEEVDRLPERYRAPIVLCYLEGLTNEEAACQLRLPASTVRVRLMRARSRLRDRLIRRGLAPAVLAGISSGRAEAAIPAPLGDTTIKAATRIAAGRAAGVSAPVAALVEGMIRAMFFAKFKVAAALLSALMLASVLMISSLAGPTQSEKDQPAPKATVLAPGEADHPKSKGMDPVVTVATARRSRWVRTTNQVGNVIAAESVDAYAISSGYLTSLRVEIGSRVKKGDLLAEVDDPELAGAVEKARAEVSRAKVRVKKAEAAMQVSQAALEMEKAKVQAASAAQGAPSVAAANAARYQVQIAQAAEVMARAQIEAAKADVEEAMSDLRIAQLGLHSEETIEGYARIKAPFDGIVTLRNYHVGDFIRSAKVGNAEPIVTVVRADTMRVVVGVPDADVPYLDVGDPAKIQINARGDGGVFQGRISRTAYAVDIRDRTLRAEIDLPNADGRLRPGQLVIVAIDLETRENALRIPRAAMTAIQMDGTATCFRVVDGRAIQSPIKVGEQDSQEVEVLEGLKEGDIVITRLGGMVSDGQAVTIQRDAHEPAAR